jgi:geranylgeranyl pyrophosphate synthase
MTNSGENHLPQFHELAKLTGFESHAHHLFQQTLLEPLAAALHRPGKNFRSKLVELGYFCNFKEGEAISPSLKKLKNLLEQMHVASLIVDDIQDQSQMRRGLPTLHLTYGTPLALNSGNWLYFWQLWQLRSLALEPQTELLLTKLCIDTYLKAHFGQSLDVGVNVLNLPQSSIHSAVLASMNLKTGALMAFAFTSGAILAGAESKRLIAFEAYGSDLGKKLQMLDDLSNLKNPRLLEKKYEDLRERRLCWPLAKAAELLSSQDYEKIRKFILENHFSQAETFLRDKGVIAAAHSEALEITSTSLKNLKSMLSDVHFQQILELENQLAGAYE